MRRSGTAEEYRLAMKSYAGCRVQLTRPGGRERRESPLVTSVIQASRAGQLMIDDRHFLRHGNDAGGARSPISRSRRVRGARARTP